MAGATLRVQSSSHERFLILALAPVSRGWGRDLKAGHALSRLAPRMVFAGAPLWLLALDHGIHQHVEAFLAHGVRVFVLVLLGKLPELAAL